MISALFDVKENGDTGELGLAMHNRRWADPYWGMAVAHDLLEHFPRDDGSVESELMALGASLYARDESNYYCQKGQCDPDPAKNIASDMIDQCRYMAEQGRTILRDPGNTRAIDVGGIDDIIQRAYREALAICRAEYSDDYYKNNPPHAWLEGHENARRFIGWVRRGYRKACRRYKGIAPMFVLSSFMEIEKQADTFLRQRAQEGMQCRITVDVRRRRVELTPIWPED